MKSSSTDEQVGRRAARFKYLVLTLAVTAVCPVSAVHAQQVIPSRVDARRELHMKVPRTFSVAAVGDIIQMRAISTMSDPSVQAWIRIVRHADVAFANMESSIADLATFRGDAESRIRVGPQSVAKDIREMGFDVVNRASNWWVRDAAADTDQALDMAGIVHAGDGPDLQTAREAQFCDTPKGRVAIVGMVATGAQVSTRNDATYAFGNAPGDWGVNPIKVTRYLVVSPAELAQLKAWKARLYERRNTVSNPTPDAAPEPDDEVDFFGARYTSKGVPGDYRYEPSQTDLEEILEAIRSGKMAADFLVANIHIHDGYCALQRTHFSDRPPQFLVNLAHEAIDNGADMFVAHGEHVLGGVEIYRGKPIFYGMSSFIYELPLTHVETEPSAAASSANYGVPPERGLTTPTELALKRWNFVLQPDNMQAILAVVRFDRRALVSVTIYPIDTGYGRSITMMGVPRLAHGAAAQKILRRIARLSREFGTALDIEGDVGLIRGLGGLRVSSGDRVTPARVR